MIGLVLVGITTTGAADWADAFSQRETLDGLSGRLTGNNAAATVEDGEPQHGGKRSRHSLWVSWIAPTNGLATFRIDTTSFDTLLGVYRLKPGASDSVRQLERVAESDDDRGDSRSFVQFGTRAGERYEIAVDGFAGATGDITLQWDLLPTAQLLPVIVQTGTDRAVTAGDTVTLSLALGDGDDHDDIEFKWFLNDDEVEDGDEATLILRDFQPSDAGHYRVRIKVDDIRFFSEPVEIQISTENTDSILARNKALDALETPLVGTGAGPALAHLASRRRLGLQATPTAGVSRGYNGSQIFNTVYASRDPLEPNHCGIPGGSSYWFAYQPPEDGAVEIDSLGSSFDTVLAAYTFESPLSSYSDLIPVTCNDNDGVNGSTSRIEFPAKRDRMYLIVLDGANGARGLAKLNYRLRAASPPPDAPRITAQPEGQTAREGSPVTLSVIATGTAPLVYQWFKDDLTLPGATEASLVLTAVSPADAGIYTVIVTNSAGSVTSLAAPLTVIVPPRITAQPESQTAREGAPVTLSVVATGTAPLVYQWFKDDLTLPGATDASLALTAVSPANAGIYTVIVTNSAGSVTSQAAPLTVIVPPRITAQPESQTAREGAPVTLSVVATGTAPLAYQWFKDDLTLPGATEASLALTAVSPANAGIYTVIVTNSAGSVTSLAAPLTVIVPPRITAQPESQTAREGAPVTLSVVATGTAPLAYQWFKDDLTLPGATEASLVQTAVSPTNAGIYTVIVTNSAGSVTSLAAPLTVIVPPRITAQPESQSAREGAPVTLSVVATGTVPLAYQWFKDDLTLPGATEASLALTAVSPTNAGIYTVIVTNFAGSVTSLAAPLTVIVPPRITAQPESQTAREGAPVTLSVVATGTAPLAYQWFKDDFTLPGATEASLALTAVSPANAGIYTVIVTNSAGSVTSQAAPLTVIVPPRITAQPESQTAREGSAVALSVIATGTAPLAYQWFKDDLTLPGATENTLVLTAVSPIDAGDYAVTVTNPAGTATSQAVRLTVRIPPRVTAPPESQTVREGSPVTLSVIASGTAPLAYQWFKDDLALSGATGSSLALATVTPADSGLYRVVVRNAASEVRTEPAELSVWAPPVAIREVASNRLRIRYAATGRLRGYLDYSDDLGTTWQPWPEPPSVAGGSSTIALDLDAARARFVRIRIE